MAAVDAANHVANPLLLYYVNAEENQTEFEFQLSAWAHVGLSCSASKQLVEM
jgi:hypothetical protein